MWQWLMSKNCFLKNAWFWLLFLGIGAAIFFSGGLLLPLAAAIPLLALAADKGLLSIRACWRWVFGHKRRQTAPYVPVDTQEAAIPKRAHVSKPERESDLSQATGKSSSIGEQKVPTQPSPARVKQEYHDRQQQPVSEDQPMKTSKNAISSISSSKQEKKELTPAQRFNQALYILDWFHSRHYFSGFAEDVSEDKYLPRNETLRKDAVEQVETWLSTFRETVQAMKQQQADYPRLQAAGVFASPERLTEGWDEEKGYRLGFKNLHLDYHVDKLPSIDQEMTLVIPSKEQPRRITVRPDQTKKLYGVVSALITGFTAWLSRLSNNTSSNDMVGKILSLPPSVDAKHSDAIDPELLEQLDTQADELLAKQDAQLARADAQLAEMAALRAEIAAESKKSDARCQQLLKESEDIRKETATLRLKNEQTRREWISKALEANNYQELIRRKQQGALTFEDIVALRDHSDPDLSLSEQAYAIIQAKVFSDASTQHAEAASSGIFSGWAQTRWVSTFYPFSNTSARSSSPPANQSEQYLKKKSVQKLVRML